jgi:hypothetical protein
MMIGQGKMLAYQDRLYIWFLCSVFEFYTHVHMHIHAEILPGGCLL